MLFRIAFVAIYVCLMSLSQALAQAQTPDIIIFPNFVTPQQLESVSHLPLASQPQIQAIEFVTHKPSNQQIQMPTQGSFKVIFRAGKSFKILDQDATDGKAIIQIPADYYDFYLQASANKALSHKEIHLEIEDPLYHIYQTIDSNLDKQWYKLSGRPMPVPSDWHNPDGNQYAISLSHQGLTQLVLNWLPAAQVTFPVGMAQIGTDGGVIELPGVAEVKFPKNAISKLTTISVRQEKEVFPGTVMLSPIVRFEPFGLVLKEPAQIRMRINATLVGKNHPVLANYSYFDPSDENGYIWKGATTDEKIANINFDTWQQIPILTKVFVSMPKALLDRDFQPYIE